MNVTRYRDAEKVLWKRTGRTPRERFVPLPRIGVKVRVQEVGEGEPVLFVHGGPNSGSTWAPLLEHLGGFRCLLVDRPGTGLSEPYPVTAGNLAEWARLTLTDELLARVRASTLFLWGEDDTFGGVEVARHLAGRMPDARVVVIPEAGHLPWLDDPAGTARMTAEFLRGGEVTGRTGESRAAAGRAAS